jgi:MFS family permease
VRGYTFSGGAGTSGLGRLVELHSVHSAGDAALAVSLAGTLFFGVPTGQARGQVALFLALTMAPFAVVAPLVGPVLDRLRHGRRWAIGATLALRAFLAWVLAGAVGSSSAWLFPAALGCLVASRAYGVSRSAAVPRLLPSGLTLVSANSRIALAGVGGAAVGGVLAGALSRVGPEWSLRLAFAVYVAGTVLAILLPARVDSLRGEQGPAGAAPGGGSAARSRRGRLRGRLRSLPSGVVHAWWCSAGGRLLAGFLTLYLAFLLREHPAAGVSGPVLLAVVVAAAGLGTCLGSVAGNRLRDRPPEGIALSCLAAGTAMCAVTAVFWSAWAAVAMGLVAGLTSQLGKLSSDALIQRDVAESVRTSVFAWSETALQVAWVVGGALGIALPLQPPLGFGVVAAVLVALLTQAVRIHLRGSVLPDAARAPDGRSVRL